jgi:hypothetical protein
MLARGKKTTVRSSNVFAANKHARHNEQIILPMKTMTCADKWPKEKNKNIRNDQTHICFLSQPLVGLGRPVNPQRLSRKEPGKTAPHLASSVDIL